MAEHPVVSAVEGTARIQLVAAAAEASIVDSVGSTSMERLSTSTFGSGHVPPNFSGKASQGEMSTVKNGVWPGCAPGTLPAWPIIDMEALAAKRQLQMAELAEMKAPKKRGRKPKAVGEPVIKRQKTKKTTAGAAGSQATFRGEDSALLPGGGQYLVFSISQWPERNAASMPFHGANTYVSQVSGQQGTAPGSDPEHHHVDEPRQHVCHHRDNWEHGEPANHLESNTHPSSRLYSRELAVEPGAEQQHPQATMDNSDLDDDYTQFIEDMREMHGEVDSSAQQMVNQPPTTQHSIDEACGQANAEPVSDVQHVTSMARDRSSHGSTVQKSAFADTYFCLPTPGYPPAAAHFPIATIARRQSLSATHSEDWLDPSLRQQ